jgi:hypothetical protein
VRPPVNIPGVDLVAAGTWPLSSGETTFTRDHLQQAIEAAQCPAVGPPIIKLGHVDPRFDGEPALGKVTNLRLTANGDKLTGDLSGVPAWLGDVAASAYPNRSVEGAFNHVCQIGHTHPFAITGLALLGVTAPGVGVLNSLDDIPARYGTAASAGFAVPIPDGWDEDGDDYVDVTDLITIDPAEVASTRFTITIDPAEAANAAQASAGGTAMSNDRVAAAYRSIMGAAHRGCISEVRAVTLAASSEDVSFLDRMDYRVEEFAAAAASNPDLSTQVLNALTGTLVERRVVAHSNQQAADQAHQAVDQASLPRQYADMAHQAVDQTFGQLDEPDDPFSGLFSPTSPLGALIDDSSNPVGLGHYTPPRTSQVVQRASAGGADGDDITPEDFAVLYGPDEAYSRYGFVPRPQRRPRASAAVDDELHGALFPEGR